MENKGIVIAIDGPGGVGKSTVSRRIAEELGGVYVDTGAMYRAFGLALEREKIDLEDEEALERFCREAEVVYRPADGSIFVNGVEYTDEIRSEEAGALASKAAAKGAVRKTLVEYQRSFQYEGVLVMEGRDIGTVVFPGADVKFYLDADPAVRARRRLADEGAGAEARKTEEALLRRDRRDATRADSPLEKALDALYVDTTELDAEGVVSLLLGHIRKHLNIP
jgi:cytidylate kinase